MDPSACKVIYIDDRFNTERWISREGVHHPKSAQQPAQADFAELPVDLQTNVNAFLSVFNQVFVCHSGRSFSTKLSELHDSDAVRLDCTPIIACFDVGSETKEDHYFRSRPARFNPAGPDSPLPSPVALRREITFSSESDESYGLQLLSRICADLQVEEGARRIIPVAVVPPKRKDSYDQGLDHMRHQMIARSPYGSETAPAKVIDTSDSIAPQMMLQCLDAGALDVVRSPLDKAGIMGLTVHAYRIYKAAKKEQASFMATTGRARKQSWVGVDEEQPYAYLREAMVRKLLKGICEPETVIEDFQHRDLYVEESRKKTIAREVGSWAFCGHDFNEDELVYAGSCMLNHALQLPELETWRISEDKLLRFMQGCRVAYNSFVLYHNFRHAVDVLQSLFYFICQIGLLPPYPPGSTPPPHAGSKSPVANLLGPFDALTLLISAIGHDVGHPGVNNMFLVKLNAPLAQLYNDQSVLEAFHCAAYSQILRRHWPVAFNDKALRKLMISSILATDMGVHSDYMQQLGLLQEKIHETKSMEGWSPKDIDGYRVLTCGLLIKCADISNVARPWSVAEKWTHLLQKEFAHQGEMESAVGMETTLFGGPPELGNMLKLANGQIGFMTIFAHPLFANVTDIIPAMGFAADEILTNKGVWFTRAEHEKRKEQLRRESNHTEGGAISPRSQSPVGRNRKSLIAHSEKDVAGHHSSPLSNPPESVEKKEGTSTAEGPNAETTTAQHARKSSVNAVAGLATTGHDASTASRRSSGASKSGLQAPRPAGKSNNSSSSQRQIGDPMPEDPSSDLNPKGEHNAPQNEAPQEPALTESISGEQDYVGETAAGVDDRRDEGVSMRAGSESIPTMQANPQPKEYRDKERSPSPLSSFKFATSSLNEPVRTYDPEQHYPPVHKGARASVPVNAMSPHGTFMDSAGDFGVGQTTSNASTTPGAAYSTATDATSLTSEEKGWEQRLSTDRPTSSEKSEFEARRKRAESAPTQVGMLQVASRESSKSDYKINGEVVGDDGREVSKTGSGGTLGRRSRIRLGLLKGLGLKRGDSEDGQQN